MEFFVKDMKHLPIVVEKRLQELRQLDKMSRCSIQNFYEEETNFFEEISNLAKETPDFDEAPIQKKFLELLSRRHDTMNALDDQMKKIQKLYDVVDGRITFLGNIDLNLEV